MAIVARGTVDRDDDGYFVGRAQELERILQGAARSPVVVVYGVAGIGKTELAFRAVNRLRAIGGWHDAQFVPIHLDARFDADLGTLLAMRLRAPGGANPRFTDADDEWALAELESRPHLIVIDDAHLSPTRVAVVIDALMRRLTRSLLLVTSQTELDLATAPVTVRLEPLPDDDARVLVRRLVERMDLGALDEEEVVRRGGGSPFLIRTLVGSGYADLSAAADPLHVSIAALPPDDRAALVRIAATSPCPIGGSMIEGLASAATLARLRRRFLISEAGGRLVVHDLVREVTLRTCDGAELARARTDAATAARATFDQSRQPVHAIEAICLSTGAGDYAAAQQLLVETYPAIAAASLDHLLLPSLAVLAAAGHREAFLLRVRVMLRMSRIDEANDLLAAETGDPSLAARWQYHAFCGIAAQRRGELARARVHFSAARDVAPAGRMRARMNIHLADVLSLAGDCDGARALLSEVTASPALGDSDRARVCWSEALSHALEQRFSSVLACIADGRRLAVRAGTSDLLGLFRMLHVIAATETGDLAAAREALGPVEGAGSGPPLRAEVEQFCRGIVDTAAGNVSDAVATLQRVYAYYRKHRDAVLACLAGHYLGRALLASGDAVAARALLVATAADAETAGLSTLVATGRIFAARAALSLGRVAEAMTAVHALRGHPWPFLRAAVTAIEAYCSAMSGDLFAARTSIRRAFEDVVEREPLRTALLVDAAEIESMGGDPEVVIASAVSALQRETAFGRRYQQERARAALIAGLLARRTPADLLSARLHLGELTAHVEAAGIGHLAARANLLRAVLEASDRDLGSDAIVAPVAMGPEAAPGLSAYLRFLGAISPRFWIVRHRGGRFGDDLDVARARAECDLVIDTIGNVLSSRHEERVVRNRSSIVDLVAWLAERHGVSVPAEDLYRGVWGATHYHPLRNRNTLYIALNRARRALAQLVPGRDVIVRARDGWMIPGDLDVCLVKPEPKPAAPNGSNEVWRG